MDQLVIAVRQARPEDAARVARVYIDSWHDTYAGILPNRLLCTMTVRGQTARWRAAIRARGRESVLVAECGTYGVVGMTSFGPSRDGGLDFRRGRSFAEPFDEDVAAQRAAGDDEVV